MAKPTQEDAADYSGRKEGYTITNLFFSDINRQSRYYISRWAGCAHDNWIWKNCKVFRESSTHFSPNEYMFGVGSMHCFLMFHVLLQQLKHRNSSSGTE